MRAVRCVLVVTMLVPAQPGHATAQTATAVKPEVLRFTQGGEDFLLASCKVHTFPAAAQTTSTCRVNDDTEAWLILNGTTLYRTSPRSMSGPVAASEWIDAVAPPATVCSGGHALFNDGLSGTTRVDAEPVCVVVLPL